MKNTNLIQIDLFQFALADFERRGINLKPLKIKSGLNHFDLNMGGNYVPVNTLYNFFSNFKRKEGTDDYLKLLDEAIFCYNLGNYGQFWQQAPDVLSCMHLGVKYGPLSFTSVTEGLDIQGQRSKYYFRFSDPSHEGMKYAIEILLGLGIRQIQQACGQQWYPSEIHIPLDTSPNLDVLFPTGYNTKLLLRQKELAIVFPTSILGMKFKNPALNIPQEFNIPGEGIRTRLETLLESFKTGFIPKIGMMAEYLDISTRTLQRQLAAENTTYFEVVDAYRFKKSLQLLQTCTVRDIASSLGYSNSENYIRAFRRWTGTTPQQYQES